MHVDSEENLVAGMHAHLECLIEGSSVALLLRIDQDAICVMEHTSPPGCILQTINLTTPAARTPACLKDQSITTKGQVGEG